MLGTSVMKELRDMKFQPSVAYKGGGGGGERVTYEILFQHCRSAIVSSILVQNHFNSIVSVN